MKKTLLLWLFGLLLTAQVFAQNRSLSGTVKDDKGEALIGVNVTGKGTTIGTVTDIDGKYTLELPKDITALVFSYIGYTNLEKTILALKVDAVMTAEGQVLEETVITAMAIKREKRSTSFVTNTVKSDDFNKGATDVFGALQAKAPGVRINNASGQMGASTRIVLRGEASVSGNNNALIIVDGIQVNNNTNNGKENSSNNSIDFGNRGADIDPNNVESVTVLKGPAAISLYGTRGQYGVIMITTKSGKSLSKEDKKFNITVSSGVSFEKVYLQLKRQDRFGQGYNNAPDPIENFSWGPRFDGVVRPWTGPIETPQGTSQLIRPYSAVKNQIEDAFDLGKTFRNSISIEGGNDKFTYYLAYGNTKNEGIFPNTFYKRNTITANATAKLSDKVSSKFNIQYSNVNQRVSTGAGSGNFNGPYQSLLQQAVNIPIIELKDYNSIYHDFNGYYGGYTPNPFYIMNNENNDNKVDNLLGSIELEVKPVEYISLMARAGTNLTLSSTYLKSPKFSYPGSSASGIGSYFEEYEKRNQLTLDFIATFNKEVAKNCNLTVIGGYNFQESRLNDLQSSTQGGLIIPEFYDITNSASTPSTVNQSALSRLIGVYGNAVFGYKNMLFAEYSVRNDWSSTLPAGKRGFFYQSGGISFVPTELLKKKTDWFSFWKIRANAGTVGGDPGLYKLLSTYDASPRYEDYTDGNLPVAFPVIGLDGSTVPGYSVNNFIGNPDLTPEKTFSWEVGTDMDLLKDYLHVEYTYYFRNTKGLIIDVALPASSGYRTTSKNVGAIVNKGHELSARISALRNVKGVNWDFSFNFTKNNNEVTKVSDESDELALNTGGVQVIAKEGYPLGTFKALDYSRDPNGNIIVNAQGAPVPAIDYSYFGSYQPKYQMGFGSNFSWKGLSMSVQFDVKQGGQFYSGTKNATDFNGTSLTSLVNDRQPYIIPGSVVSNGDGTYSENTTPITNLYNLVGSLPESQDLIDASYIKLKEASVSYTIDKKYFKKVPISAITISVFGRNLKYWLPAENVFADPESNSFGQAGNVQGLEFGSTPTARSFGFDVKVKF